MSVNCWCGLSKEKRKEEEKHFSRRQLVIWKKLEHLDAFNSNDWEEIRWWKVNRETYEIRSGKRGLRDSSFIETVPVGIFRDQVCIPYLLFHFTFILA